jgi:uncharacterized membrane protein YozB (DUF420 family)
VLEIDIALAFVGLIVAVWFLMRGDRQRHRPGNDDGWPR